MTKRILVIPSIREKNLQGFLQAWQKVGDWDEIILVEDNPEKSFRVDVSWHFSWHEIEALLGENHWIISRRDSAIRSFGFLQAVRAGATHILTMDDDCYPYNSQPPFAAHEEMMEKAPRWVPSIPGMRTRGLPYQNRGFLKNVVANMGLWTKIPDLDAVQSISNWDLATNGNFLPPSGNRIIPSGQYFPLCGMNLCFRAEAAPLFYFPLMGEGQPFSRFDDIWAGVIAKKVVDHLGLCINVGEPFVEHQRASNVWENLVREAPGIKANEDFWEIVDAIPLKATSIKEAIICLGKSLERFANFYISKLGVALQIWADLFPA